MTLETRLVDESVFTDGYGFTLCAKYRSFQTWYVLETFGPIDGLACSREFYDSEQAFNALERFEQKHK